MIARTIAIEYRNRNIYQDSLKMNMENLMVKYGLSKSRIQAIVAAERPKIHPRKRDLFTSLGIDYVNLRLKV